ncbi:MAG: hypothetical protein COV44_09355 [Deltaproteobacteria bacterium CG11_big_fil_rev_8_21_14_0_20_45_16]|nr:MAG: hypothetical protein COV44_09355 [Deltaproteobacteria bacterium CG11_big_fil_rev_8_21_14_0_20_45_16]
MMSEVEIEGLREVTESLGEFLKRHREASGKNLEEIARVTRISKRYLLALEENDVDNMPEEAFARGFLRNYAVEVGLDPEECLDRFDRFKRSQLPTQIKDLRRMKKQDFVLGENAGSSVDWNLLRSPKLIFGGVTALVVALGLVVYFLSFRTSIDGEDTAQSIEIDEGATVTAEPENAAVEPSQKGLVTPVPPSVLQIEVKETLRLVVRIDEGAAQEIVIEPNAVKNFDVYRQIEIKNLKKNTVSLKYNGKPIEFSSTTLKLFNQYMFSE